MHASIKGTLDRADELLADLKAEYERSLHAKAVSDRALQLTHEVCERLRSVLDRIARRYWDKHVAPQLAEDDKKRASIYFPISENQQAFDSTMGRWRWQSVQSKHQSVCNYLLAQQPFSNADNNWLAVLNDLAVQGKHIELVPQMRTETRRVTVETPGGGRVSWNPSRVRFGGGVRVGGAPVDPATQRIVPTQGVTERIETWVSFTIAEHNVNALGFCEEACSKTRKLAEEMSDKFDLS